MLCAERILTESYRAIRAFRHPERYGRRANTRDPTFGGQVGGATRTAAVGLTRAILDTFPIIKFGGSGSGNYVRKKDLETGQEIEMSGGSGEDGKVAHIEGDKDGEGVAREHKDLGDLGIAVMKVYDSFGNKNSTETQNQASMSYSSDRSTLKPTGSGVTVVVEEPVPLSPTPAVDPTSIGHETCPICILDFELGDDLRVLPCEGKHRFHQHCVDQWLLEMSSSCPLCREGGMFCQFTLARQLIDFILFRFPDARSNGAGRRS